MNIEEAVHRRRVPFGSWEYRDDSPVQFYHRGFGCGGSYYDMGHLYPPPPHYYYYAQDGAEDLYGVPPPSSIHSRRAKRGNTLEKQLRQVKYSTKDSESSPSPTPGRRARQARVYDCELAAQESVRRQRAAKAVDEDLYKIPPEFLRRKQKKKPMRCEFLSSCLGFNCIA
ncbi:uncharacterized protein LOC144706093 [Wolffia australiana]